MFVLKLSGIQKVIIDRKNTGYNNSKNEIHKTTKNSIQNLEKHHR